MSTAPSPRHNHLKQKIPVGKVPVGKKAAPKEEKMNEEKMNEEKMNEIARSAGRLFAFTIDANTAQVVKLETLDDSGARRELSDEEQASLRQAASAGGLEEFFEKAFEAGIACVLGEDERQHKTDEPAEEAELRHLLLTPLIEHSPVKRLIQREALNRAILGTLLQRAMKKAPADAESAPTAGPQPDRAAPARAN
jgi:hypothetical protein